MSGNGHALRRDEPEEGLLRAFGVLVDRAHRVVAVVFRENVTGIDFPLDSAKIFPRFVRYVIQENFGDLVVPHKELRIRVVPNKATRSIENHFPSPVIMFVSEPEMFLAWADAVERAIKEFEV